jgi:hypothetical protein
MANDMKRVGRKLLVASLGVASVSYGACSSSLSSNPDAAADVAGADTGSARPDAGSDGATDTQGGVGDASDAALDRQFIGNLA